MSAHKLFNLRVLLTRPRQQQQGLMDAVVQHGGQAFSLPLMAIEPIAAAGQALEYAIRKLDRFDLLVFISSNAARYGARWISDYWPRFPAGITVLAVGPTTARVVADLLGCEVIHADTGMTSEDILALPQLRQPGGKRIGIFRGVGGREFLGDTLKARGAEAVYLEVYKRRKIDYPPQRIQGLLADDGINVLTVTSGESLQQLVKIAGDNKDQLSLLPLIVPSTRIARQAEQLGFSQVMDAGGADEDAYLETLLELAGQTGI